MAFQTGSWTSVFDLLNTLNTFLTANGWTADDVPEASPTRAAWSKNSVFVQLEWDTADNIQMFGSTSYGNSPDDPRRHPGAYYSGSGNAPIINLPAIESPQYSNATYWFFERDASPAYINVVIEFADSEEEPSAGASGHFRHFGWGEIEKLGTWTGGEYYMVTFWDQGASNIDNPTSASNTVPWDGQMNAVLTRAGHIKARGLLGMDNNSPESEWLASGQLNYGNDSAGILKRGWQGSARGGYDNNIGQVGQNALNQFQPMRPIPLWYNDSAPAPDVRSLIGYAPDVRTITMTDVNPKSIITIDTVSPEELWYIFPMVRKRAVNALINIENSGYFGFAYLRNDA